MHKLVRNTLYLMLLFIPLIFTTVNYELFEFPKFLLLLTGSIVIATAWGMDIYHQKNLRSTIHDLRSSPLPLAVLAVLITQLLATIFSIDPHTSFWGYYSRFHQGLLTTICYTLIYFASRQYLDKDSTHKLIKVSVFTSVLISLYAIAERFGIDKNLWVQDVVNRPFSTLGQPNWLAAYLLPNLFLLLYFANSKTVRANNHSPLHYLAYAILFSALLLTKSRSGLLAFALSYLTYWALLARNFSFPKIKQSFILFTASCLLLSAVIGTAYSPSLARPSFSDGGSQPPIPSGTQLESGGTESGDIRKIVWTGALDLAKRRPLLGTGPETFAYSYYWTRPVAHNYTSEWDFLYNKAHNEYLNFLATSGIIGLAGYLYWHYAIFRLGLTQVKKSKKANQVGGNSLRAYYPVVTASLLSFAITNFFGFSVIPAYLMLVIISALANTLTHKSTPPQITTNYYLITLAIASIVTILLPLRLLLADLNLASGKAYLGINDLKQAQTYLERATSYNPGEPLIHSYLGETYAGLASANNSVNDRQLALRELDFTKTHNPYHLNYLKSRTKAYLSLTTLDPSYYQQARDELIRGRGLAPTDPKLAYNLGLIYSRLDDADSAVKQMQDSIALKSNYYEPYYALTLLYENTKQLELIPALLEQAQANFSPLPEPLQTKLDQYSTN